ncbi:distal tail protein Dit [Jeotgalibacillus proteolyticus]|uniref:distal tail protein Dit n=1 Tax=Jeotgalibacillus proteolyticus TaxID=2082395 RepID=UPI0014316266|nr:distal tail protein Dit [Jeotgalibacillus proteolyticus]
MINLSFNRERKPIFLVKGRRKAPFSPISRNIRKYKKGHRLVSTETELLEILQPFAFEASNDDDELAFMDELSEWLVTEEICPLQFDDEPGRTYHAVVQNTIDDFEKIGSYRVGTIQFLSFYSTGESHSLALGTSFNPFTIKGKKKTPWTSRTTFTVPQSSFTLENNLGGKVVLKYNFVGGDVLEIDYDKRKVMLNGNALQVALQIQSVWFDLKPGQLQLKASHATTLSYMERFY